MRSSTCPAEVPKNGRKAIFKEIVIENLTKLVKNVNLLKQETQ